MGFSGSPFSGITDLKTLKRGFAANLHNNLWNTNYPLFYPYYDKRFCETPLNCANRNSLFRFRLDFEPLKTVYV